MHFQIKLTDLSNGVTTKCKSTLARIVPKSTSWKRVSNFYRLLTIPASEASDETVFSDAGYLMKPRTSSHFL